MPSTGLPNGYVATFDGAEFARGARLSGAVLGSLARFVDVDFHSAFKHVTLAPDGAARTLR